MRLVLDANEYIFALGPIPAVSSKRLIDALIDTDVHDVRIQRTLVMGDEEVLVPHHVAQHYQDVGFKEGDAHIAAYAQVVQADAVISENRRHFHRMVHHLPFRVMDAETFLKRHSAKS